MFFGVFFYISKFDLKICKFNFFLNRNWCQMITNLPRTLIQVILRLVNYNRRFLTVSYSYSVVIYFYNFVLVLFLVGIVGLVHGKEWSRGASQAWHTKSQSVPPSSSSWICFCPLFIDAVGRSFTDPQATHGMNSQIVAF